MLPASFAGGSRDMARRYHDAMAIVRRFGRSDLFFTFTANPAWPEIIAALLPGQSAQDRPDLAARALQLRPDAFMDDALKGGVPSRETFGARGARRRRRAQGRQLDVVHVRTWASSSSRSAGCRTRVLILAVADKLCDLDKLDGAVCAELPAAGAATDALRRIVLGRMILCPCSPGGIQGLKCSGQRARPTTPVRTCATRRARRHPGPTGGARRASPSPPRRRATLTTPVRTRATAGANRGVAGTPARAATEAARSRWTTAGSCRIRPTCSSGTTRTSMSRRAARSAASSTCPST